MADMRFVVRRTGSDVHYWDYDTKTWKSWKPGKFEARSAGMRGHYRLVEKKADGLVLQRYSGNGNFQWEERVPQGVSAYTYQGGGPVTLVWQENPPLLLAARLVGFSEAQIIWHTPAEKELTLGLLHGKFPDGRRYTERVVTDGQVVDTPLGLRINLPGFVLVVQEIEPLVPGRIIQMGAWLHLWEQKFNGPSVAPSELVRMVNAQNLANRLESWEQDLYLAYLESRRKK